jgi:Alpha/beta hydrolase domain
MNLKLIPALLCGVATALAQTTPVPVPKATLVPVTADSHPLGAAAQSLLPVDLAKTGYVEEEFILSGVANVYDWKADGSLSRAADGPYADRILVRHPANPSRFSGTVVVEPMNAARRFDWAMMGGYLQDYIMEQGDAWVGVTAVGSVAGLQKFKPTRYASLSFANPAPDAPCAGAKGGPSATEEGLRFDVLSQVAAALKSGAPGEPMTGFKVEAIYMTTQAGDIETYINAIHPHAILANGKPAYDGYLVKNPTAPAKISQCAPALPRGDARAIIKDINVPVIAVVAQGEVVASLANRRPDADSPNGRYRLYEIAGAAHIDKYAYSTLPVFPDQIAAAGAAQGSPEWPFNAPCDPPIPLSGHPLLKYSYDAALMNLDQWARKGIAPPHEERMQVTDGPMPALVLDENSHAKGGVRSPWVDTPVATYTTTSPGPGTCAELSHTIPFTADRLKALYPTPQAYQKKMSVEVDELVKARWFTESDGKKMKAELNAALGK